MLQVYHDLFGDGALVRVGRQGGQLRDRVVKARTGGHDADQEGGTVAGELAGDDEPDAEEVGAKEVDASRPVGGSVDFELLQHRCGDGGGQDPEERLGGRLRQQAPLLAPRILRSRLLYPLVPMGEVLAQAGSKLRRVEWMSEDLDEAEPGRHPAEEAETGALGFTRRVGVVAEIGVLSISGDLELNDGDAGGVEGFLADLLGELVKGVVHGDERPTERANLGIRSAPCAPSSTSGTRLSWREIPEKNATSGRGQGGGRQAKGDGPPGAALPRARARDLEGANLQNANLRGANTHQALRRMAKLAGADLTGIDEGEPAISSR